MLWMCTEPKRKHASFPTGVSFSMMDVRQIWGSDELMREVVNHTYFMVLQGSKFADDTEKGNTSAYWPSPNLARALVACLGDPAQTDWIETTGKKWTPPRKPVASMAAGDGNRQSRWTSAQPAMWVPIDCEQLRALELMYLPYCNATEYCEDVHLHAGRRVQEIQVLGKLAANPQHPGHVCAHYREHSTGRIFSTGGHIQGVSRDVRRAALQGRYDYDIHACHWTILAALAERHQLDHPLIRDYLKNKHAFRASLAKRTDIDVANVKRCLTALLYGAPLQTSSKAMQQHPGAIAKALGFEDAMTFQNMPEVKALALELARLGTEIIERTPRLRNGMIPNQFGVVIRPDAERREILAHLLQGIEACALRAVVERERTNVLVCLHDGWVARERMDGPALERVIEEETGFKLTLEEAVLRAPTPDEIKSTYDEKQRRYEAKPGLWATPSVTSSGAVCLPPSPPASRPVPALPDPSLARVAAWCSHSDPSVPLAGGMLFTGRASWNLPPGSNALGPQKRKRSPRRSAESARTAGNIAP